VSRRLVLVLAAAGAGQAAQYLARPMTSYRLLALGAGPREVGYVAAAFAVVPVFLAIPLGRFADRRRTETLLVAGSILLATACGALAFGASVWALAAASVVLGLGHLALMLGVQNAIAGESGEDQHDARFGIFTAVVSAGQLVGPLLGGAVLSSAGALRPATTLALLTASARSCRRRVRAARRAPAHARFWTAAAGAARNGPQDDADARCSGRHLRECRRALVRRRLHRVPAGAR